MPKQEVYDVSWYRDNVKKERLTQIEKSIGVKKGRPSASEEIVSDKIIHQDNSSVLFCLYGLTPGLNGSEGLIREHWAAGAKRRDAYKKRIEDLNIAPIKGRVEIVFTRHSSQLSDWDNAAASFKKIGDALTLAGIIEDDGPEIVESFLPKQIKSRRKDQKMTILITRLSPQP